MPTRSTYSTGLWTAATQAPTSSPQAASKLSLQSVAAGIKSDNLSVICSLNRGQLPVHIFFYYVHFFLFVCHEMHMHVRLLLCLAQIS